MLKPRQARAAYLMMLRRDIFGVERRKSAEDAQTSPAPSRVLTQPPAMRPVCTRHLTPRPVSLHGRPALWHLCV